MNCRPLTFAAVALALGCSSESTGPNGANNGLRIAVQGTVATQSGVMGQPTPTAPTVVVTRNGDPVAGEVVTFTVVSGGGTVSARTATTNQSGVASVTWTLGKTFAVATLEAKLSNGQSVGFNATAIAPDGGIQAFSISDGTADTLAYTGAAAPRAIDLTNIRGDFKRDSLILTLTFSGPVTSAALHGATGLYGFLEFDMDDKASTGDAPESNNFGATANLGIDYFLDLFNEDAQSAVLYSHSTDMLIPSVFSGNTVTLRLPMIFFGSEDGSFSLVGVMGLTDRATDLVPNSGALLIRP